MRTSPFNVAIHPPSTRIPAVHGRLFSVLIHADPAPTPCQPDLATRCCSQCCIPDRFTPFQVFGALDSFIIGPANGAAASATTEPPPAAATAVDINVEMAPGPDDDIAAATAAAAAAVAVAPPPPSGHPSNPAPRRVPHAVSVPASVAKAGHARDPGKYTRYDLSDVETSAGQQAAALADMMALLNRKAAAAAPPHPLDGVPIPFAKSFGSTASSADAGLAAVAGNLQHLAGEVEDGEGDAVAAVVSAPPGHDGRGAAPAAGGVFKKKKSKFTPRRRSASNGDGPGDAEASAAGVLAMET